MDRGQEGKEIFEIVAAECKQRGATDRRADPLWWERIGGIFSECKSILYQKAIEQIAAWGGPLECLRKDYELLAGLLPKLSSWEAVSALDEVLFELEKEMQKYEHPEVQHRIKIWLKDRRIRQNWGTDIVLLWTVDRLKEVGVRKVYALAGGLLYAWGLLSRKEVQLKEGEPFLNILKDSDLSREYRLTQYLRRRAHRARKRIKNIGPDDILEFVLPSNLLFAFDFGTSKNA